ncbi:hypothetical protein LINGRAHAP2_LOCUS24251 [Linum grandiflorum]
MFWKVWEIWLGNLSGLILVLSIRFVENLRGLRLRLT